MNPVDMAVRRWGRTNTVALLFAGVIGITVLTPDGSASTVIAVVVSVGLVATAEEFRTVEPETELDQVTDRYVDGEIDLDEFEQRIEMILDSRAQEIREVVEAIGGIGPATSASIAQHFESINEVRLADVDELRRVHGVGPSLASTIRDEIGEDLDTVIDGQVDQAATTDQEAIGS